MASPQEVLDNLINGNEHYWNTFLFDVPTAKHLLAKLDAEQGPRLLSAGCNLNVSGWTTSDMSRRLWDATGVALVTAASNHEYLNCWLMALALAMRLEVPEVTLSDKGSEAAFILMESIVGQDEEEEDEDEERAADKMKLDWEETSQSLAAELKYLWGKARSGDRLDLKNILEEIPKFMELPTSPPINNHKQNSGFVLLNKSCLHYMDKNLKLTQGSLLHGLRIFAQCYRQLQGEPGEMSTAATFQIGWKHLSDIYWKLNELRMESSIPGSTSSQKDSLFNKGDLLVASTNNKIKQYRAYRRYVGFKRKNYSFRPYCSFGKGQFKSFKGGKSFGGKSGGKSYGRSFGFGLGYGSPRIGKGKGKGIFLSSKQKYMFSFTQVSEFAKGYDSQPSGHGVPQSKGEWSRDSTTTSVSEASLVAAAAPTSRSYIFGQDRVNDRSAFAPSFEPECSTKNIPTNSGSFAFDQRIFGGGGIKGNYSARSQTFNSLVPHQKDRHFARWATKRKTEINLRLPGDKQLFYSPNIQNGSPSNSFSFSGEKSVGGQSGFEACLLSFKSESSSKALSLPSSGSTNFSIPRCPLWDQFFASKMDKYHESVAKNLERARNHSICVPRRHPSLGSHKKEGGKRCFSSPAHFRASRNADKSKKVHFDTLPKFTAFGFHIKSEKKGVLEVPKEKLHSLRKELGKL